MRSLSGSITLPVNAEYCLPTCHLLKPMEAFPPFTNAGCTVNIFIPYFHWQGHGCVSTCHLGVWWCSGNHHKPAIAPWQTPWWNMWYFTGPWAMGLTPTGGNIFLMDILLQPHQLPHCHMTSSFHVATITIKIYHQSSITSPVTASGRQMSSTATLM